MTLYSPLPLKKLRVGFVLADQFTMSAFANFADVLRLASDDDDKSGRVLIDWNVLSDDMSMIRSSGGFSIQPDTRLRNARAYEYIVVVGGLMGDNSSLSVAMLDFLRAQTAKGCAVVGLCTGVFLLQDAGLLHGYKCCVSWFHHQEFLDRFAGAKPVADQLFVVDRDRLTCSGGQGTAHLAAFVVARHIGQAAAAKSLNIMMIDQALSGEVPQPAPFPSRLATDPLVKRCLHLMSQHIEVPKTTQDLALQLGVSRRTLERRLQADLGATPHQVYLDIRIERALQWLQKSHTPIAEIALACGFCDGSHFSRVLKEQRSFSPSEYRALTSAQFSG